MGRRSGDDAKGDLASPNGRPLREWVAHTLEMKQSFSTSEVATYCHVTADTIRKWAEAGRIRVFKTPGGHRRIRREDLLRFLHENSIPVHGDLKEGGVKVLVVDSQESVVNVVRRFLERSQSSFMIETATDSFEAGHRMGVFRPDIVFLDLELPGLDGVALCRRLREHPEFAGTQVIAMAPSENGDLTGKALEAGAAGGLRKPFTPDNLRRVLAQVGIEVS